MSYWQSYRILKKKKFTLFSSTMRCLKISHMKEQCTNNNQYKQNVRLPYGSPVWLTLMLYSSLPGVTQHREFTTEILEEIFSKHRPYALVLYRGGGTHEVYIRIKEKFKKKVYNYLVKSLHHLHQHPLLPWRHLESHDRMWETVRTIVLPKVLPSSVVRNSKPLHAHVWNSSSA